MWNTLHASATYKPIYKMTHTFTRKMQARFAINHDRYYSTVNCQPPEFHILHIPKFSGEEDITSTQRSALCYVA